LLSDLEPNVVATQQFNIIVTLECNEDNVVEDVVEDGATKDIIEAMLSKMLLKCCFKRHYSKR
jgi:hypothetical protein